MAKISSRLSFFVEPRFRFGFPIQFGKSLGFELSRDALGYRYIGRDELEPKLYPEINLTIRF